VEAAYKRLSCAGASDRTAAFAAYTAALDREESACREYEAHIRLITSRRTVESGPFPRRGDSRCR